MTLVISGMNDERNDFILEKRCQAYYTSHHRQCSIVVHLRIMRLKDIIYYGLPEYVTNEFISFVSPF